MFFNALDLSLVREQQQHHGGKCLMPLSRVRYIVRQGPTKVLTARTSEEPGCVNLPTPFTYNTHVWYVVIFAGGEGGARAGVDAG